MLKTKHLEASFATFERAVEIKSKVTRSQRTWVRTPAADSLPRNRVIFERTSL
jgi:hypothetical protein